MPSHMTDHPADNKRHDSLVRYYHDYEPSATGEREKLFLHVITGRSLDWEVRHRF